MRIEHLTDFELQSLLDQSEINKFDSAGEMKAHLDICSECKTAFEEYKLLALEIASEPIEELGHDFSSSVIMKLGLTVESQTSRYPLELIGFACAALLALVSIHIFYGWQWLPQSLSSFTLSFGWARELGATSLSWVKANYSLVMALILSILTAAFYELLDNILRRQRVRQGH